MPGPDLEMPLLLSALEGRGVRGVVAPWGDGFDWPSVPLVLVRSPWDYFRHLEDFLSWAERVDRVTHLANPAPVLAWNSHKRYLTALAAQGKTITALSLLGLLPLGARTSGSVRFEGRELLGLTRRQLRDVRGKQVAMVSQDPATSLHPLLRIDVQMTEHVRAHLGFSKEQARERAVEMLTAVRIPDPESALMAHPHQFSGGMRQRIAIAMALACEPRLLVADEPTTALDVTVQAGILRLLDRLRRERGVSVMIITHDLGVLSSVSDRICILCGGRVAEYGSTPAVLGAPRHPYTEGLMRSLPGASATGEAASSSPVATNWTR